MKILKIEALSSSEPSVNFSQTVGHFTTQVNFRHYNAYFITNNFFLIWMSDEMSG
jgi:hypothetical protein